MGCNNQVRLYRLVVVLVHQHCILRTNSKYRMSKEYHEIAFLFIFLLVDEKGKGVERVYLERMFDRRQNNILLMKWIFSSRISLN